LGGNEFEEQVLKAADELTERRYELYAKGAKELGMDPGDVLSRGKVPHTVKAHGLLCHGANREPGMTTVELSQRLRISQSAINMRLSEKC
jgi:hypothetical protein